MNIEEVRKLLEEDEAEKINGIVLEIKENLDLNIKKAISRGDDFLWLMSDLSLSYSFRILEKAFKIILKYIKNLGFYGYITRSPGGSYLLCISWGRLGFWGKWRFCIGSFLSGFSHEDDV